MTIYIDLHNTLVFGGQTYNQYCRTVGVDPGDVQEKMLTGQPYECVLSIEQRNEFNNHERNSAYFAPEAVEFLNMLKEDGIQFTIISDCTQNWFEGVKWKLVAREHDFHHARHILSFREGLRKPDLVTKHLKPGDFMIGDSQRRDINPALKAGADAIHIPDHTYLPDIFKMSRRYA